MYFIIVVLIDNYVHTYTYVHMYASNHNIGNTIMPLKGEFNYIFNYLAMLGAKNYV